MIQSTSMEGNKMHYGWKVVFGGFLTQIILLIAIMTLPIMLSLIEESLGITHAAAGTIVSVFGLCYAGFSFFWGYLADRLGTRIALTIAGLITAVFIIAFGASVNSLTQAIILYAFVGFGSAGIYSATIPKLIGEWFHPSKRGRAMSLITPGGVLTGAALGIVVPILATNYGWQNGFVILGVVALVVVAGIFVIVRNKPSEMGLTPVGGEMAAAPKAEGGEFIKVLGQGITWHMGIMYIFWQLGYMAVTAFLAVSLKSGGDYTLAQAGLAVTIYNLFQLVGQQIWGPLSDKMERKTVIAISALWWTVFTFAYVFVFGSSLAWMYVVIALMGIGIGNVPVLLATFSDYYPAEYRGTGTGVLSTLAIVGRFFGPMVAGIVADKTGNITAAFTFAASMMLICAIISVTLPGLKAKEEAKAA